MGKISLPGPSHVKLSSWDEVVRHHAAVRPDSVAISCENIDLTFAELDQLAQMAAELLTEWGLQPGDRLAYIGKNSADFVLLLAAAARAGFVLAPLNWRLSPFEIRQIITDMAPKAAFLTAEYAHFAPDLQAGADTITAIVQPPDAAGTMGGWLMDTGRPVAFAPRRADDVLLQLYTSGTTGQPKGVMLSHRSLTWQRGLSAALPSDYSKPDEVLVMTMAPGHIGGIQVLARGLYHGAKTVVLPEYDTHEVAEVIRQHRVTRLVVAPAMLRMLLDHAAANDIDYSSLRYIQYGASPMPIDLLQRAVDTLNIEFIQVYGMTEMGGAVTSLRPDDHKAGGSPRMSSVGLPLPGVQIRVSDLAGRILAPFEVGEIEIRGGGVMRGYWRRPEETAAVLDRDGWLKTGDAGYLDEDGYLFLCDRMKDMICTGGENVYPTEVEQALLRNAKVKEAVVIGVPHPQWGEAVKAIVVLKEGADFNENEIIADARKYLAGFKLPKSIDIAAAIPRDGIGKVRRKDLREPFWIGRDKRIG